MQNSDVRSTVRDAGFPAAAAELKKLGVRAVVESGTIPIGRHDVQGMMAGTQESDWSRSGSTILPGALCELLHQLWRRDDRRSQPNAAERTDPLRRGRHQPAPLPSPTRFRKRLPLRPCRSTTPRAARWRKSFYQSVAGPYQLLIVGDPLCRPWANIPAITSGEIRKDATLKGIVEIHPSASFAGSDQKTSRRRSVDRSGTL